MLDIAQLLGRHARRIEALLEREVPRGGLPFIAEGVWYQFASGGKRLRPALCLLTCEALGGDPERALPFALATEILHNFLLIHDDIEDGDTMRRDQETLWKRLGVPNAINVGDFLIAKAYQLILGAPLPTEVNLKLARIFSNALERTVEGQALDINLRGSPEVTLETYHRVVQLKTAYYLALTWVGGAVAAGVRDEALEPLWELGRCLGPAFQIRDDIIDMTEGKGRGGEVGCDLREGKPSICFAYVLDRAAGTEAERSRLVEIVRRPREETTAADVAWAIGFYRSAGAMDFAQETARSLIDRACGVIETLPLDPEGKETFRAISRYIIDRSS
ncbi:MAG: polyprenyl synthetase family protein [Planctomycetes bacterium]|nr:polyprenyl synthetase family protein [Planctomycetota bacterium]